MSEVLLPPWIVPEHESHEWLDEGSSVFRAAFAPGLAQRQSYGGPRLKLSRRHTVRGEEKAQLLSTLKATRGSFNALRTKVHFALRGSFASSEVLSNNTFASGTTGWSGYNSASTLSVADRLLRVEMNQAGSSGFHNTSAITSLVQYAPYLLKAMVMQGRVAGVSGSVRLGATAGAAEYIPATSFSSAGMFYATGVPYTVSAAYALIGGYSPVTGLVAGDYFNCNYVSISRVPLVDNGENALLYSDDCTQSVWTATGVAPTYGATAADGTATASRIIEDGSTGGHFVTHSAVTYPSSVADFCLSCVVLAGTRSWCFIEMVENTGSSFVVAYFNASTGSFGTVTTGANWASTRTFVTNLGGGFYRISLVSRKTNAATSITSIIGAASADNTASYTGTASGNAINVWRATFSQSSVPSRLVQTGAIAFAPTAQTGNALHVKGLPASSTGLLLPGDWVEVSGELKQVTCQLNSDSAGIGYLQFEPPLVRSPAEASAVSLVDPMGKFLVSNIKIDNEFGTQARVSYDLEHIYE